MTARCNIKFDLTFWSFFGVGHSASHWHLLLPFSTERLHVCPHIFDRLPHEVLEYRATQTGCLTKLQHRLGELVSYVDFVRIYIPPIYDG